MKIVLIRHGQTEANVQKLVCGQLDTPLTELGKRQAASLKPLIRQLLPSFLPEVATSTLTRAVETAKILFDGSVTYKPDSRLNETNTGAYSHLTFEELHQVAPQFKFEGQARAEKYPQGECIDDVYHRIKNYADDMILGSSADSHIIVGHGGTVNCLLHYFLNTNLVMYPAFPVRNASISIVNYECGLFRLCEYNKTGEIQ